MKNKLLICVLLSFSIIISCISVYATENVEETLMIKATDSLLKSDDKQLQKLGVSVDEQAVKVYNLCLVEAFSRCDNIDDMVSKWSIFSPEYFIVSGDSIDRVVVMNEKDEIGEVISADRLDIERYKLSMTEFLNKNAIKLIGTDVKIEHCYYFYGESTPGDGIAIYYETNYGVFVYYCHGAGEYLLPLEKFVAMMKRVDNSRGPDTPPGSNTIVTELYALSKYDIHSEKFNITTNTDTQPEGEDLQSQPNVEDESQPDKLKNSAKLVFTFAGVVLLISASVFIGIGLNRGKRKNQQG